jgi:biopolymer transport protein ExbD
MAKHKKKVDADGTVAPNLIPMVDIMFLLLLFLMLGSDMSQRELEDVTLPVASSVKEEKEDDNEISKRVTINVFHYVSGCSAYSTTKLCSEKMHWSIGIRGTDYKEGDEPALKSRLEGEVQLDREKRGLPAPEPGKPKPPSELRVMIRADEAALYAYVQRAMNCCAEAGIYKIEIGAAQPIE